MPTKPTLQNKRRNTSTRIEVQVLSRARSLPSAAQMRRWAQHALRQAAHITVRLVGPTEARRLNQQFRQRDYSPNVLTFVYQTGTEGDIILCPQIIGREARVQGKTLDAHYAHLVVHAVLHLRGFTHHRPDAAARMERAEIRLLRELGYANPYVIRT